MTNLLSEQRLCKDPTIELPFIKGLSPHTCNEIHPCMMTTFKIFYRLKFRFRKKLIFSLKNGSSWQMKISFKYFFVFFVCDEIFKCLTQPLPVLHPTQDEKKLQNRGGSFIQNSLHKRKMVADKSKICLQIFYQALKACGAFGRYTLLGGEFYRTFFLQKYSLTYRIGGGSSAKIFLWASKKRRIFKISLHLFEA